MSEELGFREKMRLLRYGLTMMHELIPPFIPVSVTYALIQAAQPLTAIFFSARILNELSVGKDVRTITMYAALAIFAAFVLSTVKAYVKREWDTRADWGIVFNRQRMSIAERFMTMDFAYTEDSKLTELLARMDTQARGNGLGLLVMYQHSFELANNLFELALSTALLINFIAMSGGLNVSTFWLVTLGAMFVAGLVGNFYMRSRENAVLEEIYKENERANTNAQFYMQYIQAENAAKDARIYDQSPLLVKIFKESFQLKPWLSFFFFEGHVNGFLAALLALGGGSFFILSGMGALTGAAPLGGIVQSVGAVTALASSVVGLANSVSRLYTNAPFLKPARDFMTLPKILCEGTMPVPEAGEALVFELRDISFKYPGSDAYALRNLNLKLRVGKRLAVVGMNGSGKTTMIKLLCRLYDPTEGEILLNGVNIKDYKYDEYIKLFSVVFQDYKLFPLWLGRNVSMSGEPDEGRVLDCLEKAGFAERYRKMPSGLDTILYTQFDEKGTQISGGEAQKIALARALYKDAPIVVLDEPTAALDPIAEFEVYEAFDRTIGSKTCVFISHRLSSCKFCDDIAVFDSGCLVQRGSHAKLLADTSGRYHELWNAQASHYQMA